MSVETDFQNELGRWSVGGGVGNGGVQGRDDFLGLRWMAGGGDTGHDDLREIHSS